MGTADRAAREIHGKIVYFGATGAGKSANLAFIQRKLKREHRGEMKKLKTKDGSAEYETLPVQLGAVRSYTTSIQIFTTPGSPSAVSMRRQILDRVDGVVFVADLRPARHDATLSALAELRQHLEAHGRKLEDVPLVLQYNHRDEADENAVEKLHHKLGLRSVSCFEARAHEGTGVLQTLTTLSKLVLMELRKTVDDATPQPVPVPRPSARETPARVVEEVEPLGPPTGEVTAGYGPSKSFQIESAGPVSGAGQEIRIPLRLVDEATGRRVEIAVKIAIGPL